VFFFFSAIPLCAGMLAQTSSHASPHALFLQRLVDAALERTLHSVRYEPAYVRIPYPGGDVPADTGVCTDEVIRSYRALGVDLQKEVHEDMVQNFSAYPRKWQWFSGKPDANIDHRRVPNLMVFFQRKGEALAVSNHPEDYSPGELVTYDLGGNVPHIGIVVDRKGASGRYMIEHNIGQGPKIEDVLFNWKITGHYRYYGPSN
jgi:uncharacterized protein